MPLPVFYPCGAGNPLFPHSSPAPFLLHASRKCLTHLEQKPRRVADPDQINPAQIRLAAMNLLTRREHSLRELTVKLNRRFPDELHWWRPSCSAWPTKIYKATRDLQRALFASEQIAVMARQECSLICASAV